MPRECIVKIRNYLGHYKRPKHDLLLSLKFPALPDRVCTLVYMSAAQPPSGTAAQRHSAALPHKVISLVGTSSPQSTFVWRIGLGLELAAEVRLVRAGG